MVDARHLDKSPDAFRTISEVADDLELPQHVLRFWETRFTHIRPVKRAGGRRYYRPDDVELLRGIRHLLYSEGYTIKGVQKILKDQGVRHVQAIGYDDGEPMPPALMAAAPARPAAPPPASEEGGGFGGLLGGLLPRRRPRLEAEDLGVPSAFDEPPLPFPDFASFTPRSEDVPEPRRAPAPESSARAAPARGQSRPAAPPPKRAERAEPVFDADAPEDDPYRSAPVRQDPSFDAVPRRPAPLPPQRPSRGPASRLPEPPAARELEDPLLPFFDDDLPPAEQISEPLDARIRRMKDAAPPAPPPLPGPPEEYIPARARKRAVSADREPPRAVAQEPPRRTDPRDYAPRGRADLDDELAGQGDLYRDDDTDWHRPVRGMPAAPADAFPEDDFPADDRFAPPRMPRGRGPVSDDPYRGREAEPHAEPPRAAQPRERMPSAREPEWAPPPMAARPRSERPGVERGYGEPPPLTGQRSTRDPFFDPPPPVQAPLVAPPRLGPFLGPMEEYDPDEPESHASYRADLGDRRAAERRMEREPRSQGRYRDERDYESQPPRDARSRGRDAWGADEDEGDLGRPVHRDSGEGWRDHPEDYLPPEPLRPGPPEQYLPPHLRSEPRMTGAPTPPAPVLSRDDISRLQATLFELTECRRLMGAVLAEEAPEGDGA